MPPRRSRSSVKTEEPNAEEEEEDSKNVAVKNEKQPDQNQWVIITPDGILESDPNNENKPVFVKLKHPKSEQDGLFLFTHEDRNIYEVQRFSEKFRSWLIDETVQEDGSILMVTPMDPVYMVLPYLIKAAQSGKFMTLDQIVVDNNYPECRRLQRCTGLSDLSYVSDIKGDEDFQAYRYNKEKTLSWLKIKVDKVVERLQDKQISVGSTGHSSTYVRSLKEGSTSIEEYRRYACGMVSDYLPLDLSSSLLDYLDIPVPEVTSPVEEPPNKKVKLEPSDLNPTEDYSKGTKKVDKSQKNGAMTIGQKKLLNADKTGMKNISSFFSPKSKR